MKIITREFLEAEPKACEDQVEIFAAEWPNGMEITAENILRADQLDLYVWWFINNKLPHEVRDRYEAAKAQAQERFLAETDDQAQERHKAARDQAWERYMAEAAPILAQILLGME